MIIVLNTFKFEAVAFLFGYQKQLSQSEGKDALSKIIDMIHDEFAFDGYLDDGVEDVNMGENCFSFLFQISHYLRLFQAWFPREMTPEER